MDFSASFQKWTVFPEESGQRLQIFLSHKLSADLSLRQIKKVIESNGCIVNGNHERFASYRVRSGDLILFNGSGLTTSALSPLTFVFSKKQVVFENSSLIIYNKTSGISSDETGLFTIIKKEYPQLFMVHRLDKETSGAIIFAKSIDAKNALIDSFKKKIIQKTYLAIADGVPKSHHGTIDIPLGKIREISDQTFWGRVPPKKGGLSAITKWEILAHTTEATLLKCTPITGRTHQIRVHLSLKGHPILGDKLYAKKFVCKYHIARHLLHSYQLSFIDPLTGETIMACAPIPEDFKQATRHLFGEDCENFNC